MEKIGNKRGNITIGTYIKVYIYERSIVYFYTENNNNKSNNFTITSQAEHQTMPEAMSLYTLSYMYICM